jgi:hypothetical protein
MCGLKELEVIVYSVLNVAIRCVSMYKHTEFSVFIDSKYIFSNLMSNRCYSCCIGIYFIHNSRNNLDHSI